MQNRSKQSLTKVLTYFTHINQDCIQNKCSDDLSACGDDFNDCHERMSAAFFYRIRPGFMMVGCECIRKLMRATSRLYRQRSKRQWLMLHVYNSFGGDLVGTVRRYQKRSCMKEIKNAKKCFKTVKWSQLDSIEMQVCEKFAVATKE